MLAIAQAGQQFHYLSWTPTTTSPVLNGYGVKSYDNVDLSSYDFFKILFGELIEKFKLNTPRIHLTMDMDSVHLSETQIPQNTEFQFYQNWLMDINYDSEFLKRYETFYYPFSKKVSKSLNIHLPLPIKEAIIKSIKFHNAELRILSLGIFSAESCLRSLYNADKINNYIVWRIGQYNQNDILWIKNNNLINYIRFKNINGVFNLQNFYGCSKSADKILSQLEKCTQSDFSIFNISDKIFIYSSNNTNNQLNDLVNINPKQFEKIEVLKKLNLNQEKQNPYIFPETGIAFRGFDV